MSSQDFDPLDVLGPPAPPVASTWQPSDDLPTAFISPPQKYVCVDCGSCTDGRQVTPGSFLIEVGLWLFGILPGLIYSLWRLTNRHVGCTACGGRQLVPSDTPRGRQLAAGPR